MDHHLYRQSSTTNYGSSIKHLVRQKQWLSKHKMSFLHVIPCFFA